MRMYRDLSVLWVRDNWAFVVSALLLAQATLTYVSPLAALLAGIAVLLSVLMFVREAWTNRKEARSQSVERRRDPAPTELKPPSAWSDGEFHQVGNHTYLTSDTADRFIRSGNLGVEYSAIAHTLPAFVSQVVSTVVAYRRRSGSLIFNGPVLRLDNDPATQPSASSTVVVRPAKYFDALTTDYLSGHQIVSRDHRRVILTGSDFAVDRRGYVRDLEQSWSANLIGVSTIAFTTDRQILLVQQTDKNVSERGRLAPSGSGSAEPRDASHEPELLNDVLARAMERELREECNLSGVAMRTRVIGYSRWIDHGAKPEFYGVTAVAVDERAILDIDVSTAEQPLVGRVRTEALDVSRVHRALDAGGPAALESLLDGAISTPLTMCLRALAETLQEDPGLVDRLMDEVLRGA
jgi:hypothetical protein